MISKTQEDKTATYNNKVLLTNIFNIEFDQKVTTDFKQLSNCSINEFIKSVEYDFQDCLKPRLIVTYTNSIVNKMSVYKILKQVFKPNNTDVRIDINFLSVTGENLENYSVESQKIFLTPFDKLNYSTNDIVCGKMFIYIF